MPDPEQGFGTMLDGPDTTDNAHQSHGPNSDWGPPVRRTDRRVSTPELGGGSRLDRVTLISIVL